MSNFLLREPLNLHINQTNSFYVFFQLLFFLFQDTCYDNWYLWIRFFIFIFALIGTDFGSNFKKIIQFKLK